MQGCAALNFAYSYPESLDFIESFFSRKNKKAYLAILLTGEMNQVSTSMCSFESQM